jgi:hypothetical protein
MPVGFYLLEKAGRGVTYQRSVPSADDGATPYISASSRQRGWDWRKKALEDLLVHAIDEQERHARSGGAVRCRRWRGKLVKQFIVMRIWRLCRSSGRPVAGEMILLTGNTIHAESGRREVPEIGETGHPHEDPFVQTTPWMFVAIDFTKFQARECVKHPPRCEGIRECH